MATILCTHLCERNLMTGQRCSNDRDFTISFHNTNQTHHSLVYVLLPLLKKGLFAQGSDYNVPLIHYPQGVSHSVAIFGASLLKQDKPLRLTLTWVRTWTCFKLSCSLGAQDTVDMTSSWWCKGETHVLFELHDWSELTAQLQLEEMCGSSSACCRCSSSQVLNKSLETTGD